VNEQGLVKASRKGKDEHQGIVQSEGTHDGVTVQGAATMREVRVG
jgi:hypothetical protein